jgi:hypothetical protein
VNLDHATPELFAALSKAQGEIENATKNAANPHFRSRYADLAEVLNTVRPVFAAHGLSLTQAPSFDGSLASVSTVIGHSGGGYIVAVASCVPAKSDAQGIGSATTYLRRYGAAAAAGIAQEDDDGQAAAHTDKPKPVGQPTSGVWESLDVDTQVGLEKMAASIRDFHEAGDIAAAFDYIKAQKLGTDEMAGLWTRLDSKIRTALKKQKESQA